MKTATGRVQTICAALACFLLAACAPAPREAAQTVPAATPKVSIEEISMGAPDALMAPGPQLVRGRAAHARGIEIEIGAQRFAAEIEEDGTFWTMLALPPDAVRLKVRAVGADEGTDERDVPLEVAPEAALELFDLDRARPTGRGEIRVRGTARFPILALEVQGDPVPLKNGAFDYRLLLPREGLVPIVIEAVLPTGLREVSVRAVRYDGTAPRLEVGGAQRYTAGAEVQIEITADEPLSWLEISGERRSMADERSAKARLALAAGENPIEVRAADVAGNVASRKLTVVRDEVPPLLRGCVPREPTRAEPVLVRCEAAEALSSASIGGRAARLEAAWFEVELGNIPEGPQVLEVVARDLAGNETRGSHGLLLDRTPPVLTVEEPPDGEAIQEALTIAGRTEPGARVFLGDVPVPVFGGRFAVSRRLAEGEHALDLTARDRAGNESRLSLELEIDPLPKKFLRRTGKIPDDAPPPHARIDSPEPNRVYGGEVPVLVADVAGSSLSVSLDGAPLLVSFPLSKQEPPFSLSDILQRERLIEGEHLLEVIATDASGRQLVESVRFVADRTPPKIRWLNLLPGERYGALVPRVAIDDETKTKVEMSVDGAVLAPGAGITVAREGPGPHEVCARAEDAAGNRTEECRAVVLEARPFSFRRAGDDPRIAAQAPLRRELLDPLLEDLVRSGILTDLFLGNLQLLVEGAAAFYPDLENELAALREVVAEQAAGGELGQPLRALLVLERQGPWPVFERHAASLLEPPLPIARSPLAVLIEASEDYLPKTPAEVLVLDALLAAPLAPDVNGPLELIPAFLNAPADLRGDAWRGLFAWSARLAESDLPTALGALGRATTRIGLDGASDFERSLLIFSALLGEDAAAPLPRLVAAYLEATTAAPARADMEAFRSGIARLLSLLSDPELLAALGRMLDTPLLPATQEWLRRSIERGDLPLFTRTLSEVSLKPSPRNPNDLVLDAGARALARLWEPDRRDPGHSYAGTVTAALGPLLQKGEDGFSTVDDFLEFLDGTTELDRRRMGLIFLVHSRAGRKGVDPFAAGIPTDAERLMKLFALANSPLNCGAPVPFTDQVIPLNVPGLPMLFPTDNLVTELMEASTFFDPDTVLQLARLMPKVARLMAMGDVFCEPEIVGDLLSDVEVLEANLDHPLLPDLLKLARRMVLRGQHHAVVRMLTAFADAGVLADSIPFLATLYQGDGAERLYQVSVRQRAWTLAEEPRRSALAHSLEALSDALLPRGGAPAGLPDALDRLRIFFSPEALPDTVRVLRHLSQRMVMNEAEPGLGRLDLLFASMLAADPGAQGARILAKLLDADAANGDLIAVARAFPPADDDARNLWRALPDLTRRLSSSGILAASFEAGRRFVAIDAESGGNLRWVVSNGFLPVDPGRETALARSFHALGPFLRTMGGEQRAWRLWTDPSGGGEGLRALLKSTRMWTRRRARGAPHLLRVRGLLSAFASLPAPDGRGRFVDRANLVLARGLERGLGRTVFETLELLDRRGYLDRREPNLVEWLAR